MNRRDDIGVDVLTMLVCLLAVAAGALAACAFHNLLKAVLP